MNTSYTQLYKAVYEPDVWLKAAEGKSSGPPVSRLVADALLHDAAPPPLKKQKPLVSPPPAPPSRATPETKKPRMRGSWMPWNGGS